MNIPLYKNLFRTNWFCLDAVSLLQLVQQKTQMLKKMRRNTGARFSQSAPELAPYCNWQNSHARIHENVLVSMIVLARPNLG